MSETRYLNVDLELRSAADLSPLAEHWGERVMVLFNHRVGECYHLALETAVAETSRPPSAADADACIQDFLALFSALPSPLLALWTGCTSRTFDIGVTAGTTPPAFALTPSEPTLRAVAELGAAARLTVYACPASPDEHA